MTGTTAPPTHADGGATVRAVLVPVAAGLMIGTLFVLVYLSAWVLGALAVYAVADGHGNGSTQPAAVQERAQTG